MRLIALLASTWPSLAMAHTVDDPEPALEAWVVVLLAAAACLYGGGLLRLWRTAGRGRGIAPASAWAFAGGWLALAVALLPPLDPLGTRLFSAHMVQHELLMLVAAPLLVLGRPLAVWTWALPARWRLALPTALRARPLAATWQAITAPVAAWLLHAAALWLWHLPGPFTAALQQRDVHAFQHASFLFTALLFWWAVLAPGLRRDGMAMLYLFSTMLHTGALGALLVVSSQPWYPAYGDGPSAWGLTALEDQQLGGLIMWIPGGLVYLAAALGLGARWVREPST